MTCRRAFEADLPAVLHGESRDADFLAHYPSCAACASEVGVWRELDGMLRTRTPDDDGRHPDPEALVAFADAILDDRERATVARHLATCRVCGDELKALAGFDPADFATAAAIDSAPARSALARVVWHPAFAYALVAVLLVPIVLERWPQMETRVAEDKAPAEPESMLLAERDGAARLVPPPPPPPPAAPAVHAAPPAQPRRESAPQEKAPQYAASTEEELARARERRQLSKMGKESADADARGDTGAVARVPRMEAPLAGAAPSGRLVENAAPRALADAVVPERLLEIRADAPNVFAPPPRDVVVRLRVAAPPALGAGPVDVAVSARASGAAILTWRAARADAIAIDIPPNWLAPGDYSVGLSPVTEATSGTSQSAMEIRFTVRAPTSADSGP